MKLLADRYAPRQGGKLPTILVRSPYGRRGFFGLQSGRLVAERGFQVLVFRSQTYAGGASSLDTALSWVHPWWNRADFSGSLSEVTARRPPRASH